MDRTKATEICTQRVETFGLFFPRLLALQLPCYEMLAVSHYLFRISHSSYVTAAMY